MDLYHVLNRGVDKRNVVIDDHDRLRFIHDLFVFNDEQHVLHSKLSQRKDECGVRKLLVHIHSFCLMPNHYHLLLSPLVENGISLFMKKLNMGYTKYFNERYARSGALWQGKSKKILIERDAHLMYIPYYIHLNPLDMEFSEWRSGKVQSVDRAFDYLSTYRWSSHLDYIGIKNFPSITHREFLSPLLGSKNIYEKNIKKIIADSALAGQSIAIE
jgi:putative transposase